MGNALPLVPAPSVFAQIARKNMAPQMRQKFASTPPSRVEVRWPQMAEMENNRVVSSAANMSGANGNFLAWQIRFDDCAGRTDGQSSS
jgi:hypothetical protein